MPPLRVRLAAPVLVALCAVTCGEPSPAAAPSPSPSTPPVTDAKAPVPAEAKAPAPAEAKAPTPVDPTPTAEDWLVWSDQGGRWVTRWLEVGPKSSTRVAERQALVLSDGARLWVVERKDGEVDVIDCDCFDAHDGDESDCPPTSRVVTPGLQATELGSGAVTVVRAAGTDAIVGGDLGLSIDVEGGVGPRLAYEWGDSGYFCGAHGMYESSFVLFDLSTGAVVERPFDTVDRALPAEVRNSAAREIERALDECEDGDGPTLAEVLGEHMGLVSLHMSVTDGEPRLSWHFEAETFYACSVDYAAHGDGWSGLVPAAAPLGLHELPDGVRRAVGELRNAPTVGWARVSLQGPARAAALQAFERAPETPWPPSSSSERAVAAAGTTEAPEPAKAKASLDEGRRRTRAGDFASAIASYDAAIALDRTLARAWSERGYAKLLAGDLVGAKADLDAALPLEEGKAFQAAVHYNLGLVAEKSGEPKAAKAAFEASLALREHEAVRKALARVQ